MSIPYGYYLAPNGYVIIDQEKANIVRMIYQQYLSGMSLGGIADFLFESNIPSPKGKGRWTLPARTPSRRSVQASGCSFFSYWCPPNRLIPPLCQFSRPLLQATFRQNSRPPAPPYLGTGSPQTTIVYNLFIDVLVYLCYPQYYRRNRL